jgi:nucleoside-diphosphate-sugar epimerase
MQALALVTGASGFIGSELVRELNRRGLRVRVLLRKSSSQKNLEGCAYEVAHGDITQPSTLVEAVNGVDYVFHLAGLLFAADSKALYRVNGNGTGALAAACAKQKKLVRRFVYVSSLAAGGPALLNVPRTEAMADEPVSDYGKSKLAGETELAKFPQLSWVVIRPPVVFGPRDRGILEFVKVVNAGVIPSFRPTSTSQKDKTFSVIHVEDLVRGILECAFTERNVSKEKFFLADPSILTWSQVMAQIQTALGKRAVKLTLPPWIGFALSRVYSGASKVLGINLPFNTDKWEELRQDNWICSSAKAKAFFGFQTQRDHLVALPETVRWYKEQRWI